jgi:hypothetical protein
MMMGFGSAKLIALVHVYVEDLDRDLRLYARAPDYGVTKLSEPRG